MINGLARQTRDGSPSVAFLCEEREQPAFGSVQVDVETVTAWARANGVKLDGPGSKIARINSARFAAGLPSFTVVQSRSGDAPIMAKPAQPAPATDARSTACLVQPALLVTTALVPPPIAGLLRTPGPRTIKTQDEFLELVTEFDGTLSGLLCTPELAGWTLDTNTANRPMNKTAVERFRIILREGQWKLTGEPIIISRQGVLSDGQHRLQAVRDTGISALTDFRFGVDRDAFAATGTGSRRTTGNILAIAGRQHASAQAAIARLLHHYDANTMARSNQQVEASVVLEIADQEEHLPAIAAWTAAAKFAPARTSPIGMVLAVAARSHPLDRVLEFAGLIASGVAEDTNSARLLHLRLRDAAMSRTRLHQTEVAALAMRAFNLWISGKQVSRLVSGEHDRTNEGFPRVAGVTP